MQGLQDLWGLPKDGYSWATAGYMGAISSGASTCGLLIGTGTAIGLRCGRGLQGLPEEHQEARQRANQEVNELYQSFIRKFGAADCRTLSGCDFSRPEDVQKYVQDKVWKETCDVYLRFVMTKCLEMAEAEKT